VSIRTFLMILFTNLQGELVLVAPNNP